MTKNYSKKDNDVIMFQIKMENNDFQNVFTRKVSAANVTTAEAEEKLLEDDQYVPPSGHLSFLKCKSIAGGAGTAAMVSLGGRS